MDAISGATAKVAGAIADELGAVIVGPERGDLVRSGGFMLVGFGSSIFHGAHQSSLLELADELPAAALGRVFLFSTCGIPASFTSPELLAGYVGENHAALREKHGAKGYEIAGGVGPPRLE